jgi:hypothetical protein
VRSSSPWPTRNTGDYLLCCPPHHGHALGLAAPRNPLSGNRRGIDDDQEFYVVEHWASPAALAAHERTEAFIDFGQEVLVRNATLHDTVTARAFDTAG